MEETRTKTKSTSTLLNEIWAKIPWYKRLWYRRFRLPLKWQSRWWGELNMSHNEGYAQGYANGWLAAAQRFTGRAYDDLCDNEIDWMNAEYHDVLQLQLVNIELLKGHKALRNQAFRCADENKKLQARIKELEMAATAPLKGA